MVVSRYLQEANVIAGNGLNQVFRRRDLTESHLEVIRI